MANEQASGSAPATAVEGISVSDFMVAATPAQILLTFGQAKMVPQQGQLAISWNGTLITSPTSAKYLLMTLTKVIADYEASFGSIPTDPAAPVQFS